RRGCAPFHGRSPLAFLKIFDSRNLLAARQHSRSGHRSMLELVKGADPHTMTQPSTALHDDDRERALLARVAERDRAAFEELYCGYHRRLTRFLGRLTQRHDLIEEIINDCLWIVWQKAGDFRGGSMVSTWIMGIAYRCTLKSLRRDGGPTTELTEQFPDETI